MKERIQSVKILEREKEGCFKCNVQILEITENCFKKIRGRKKDIRQIFTLKAYIRSNWVIISNDIDSDFGNN